MVKTIPDEQILALLELRVLIVDYPFIRFKGKELTKNLAGSKGERFRVELRFEGKKRTLLVSRLVYMAETMRVIPDGSEIHHLDGDRFNDHPSNLIALTANDHYKFHRWLEKYDGIPF